MQQYSLHTWIISFFHSAFYNRKCAYLSFKNSTPPQLTSAQWSLLRLWQLKKKKGVLLTPLRNLQMRGAFISAFTSEKRWMKKWCTAEDAHVFTHCKDKIPKFSKQIFPEKEYRGVSPNFHIHASVSDLYIATIGLPILLEEVCTPIMGLYKSLTDAWMWKLGLRPRYSQKRNT